MFTHLVESWTLAGGFLQNVNISIKEKMGNTFITVFWPGFALFRWGQKGKAQTKGYDDATENLLWLKVFIAGGFGLEGCKGSIKKHNVLL